MPRRRAGTTPTASISPPAPSSTMIRTVTDHTSGTATPSTVPPPPPIPADMEFLEGTSRGSTARQPSIQFFPHREPRSQRPSLVFEPISRLLPDATSVIRVGRYSEREGLPEMPTDAPSDAPVGFKSKVVSRRHCEFFARGSQWFVKDVKSSSGTFLNHIRLSQPGQESRPFPIKDGDLVQLGIDFKGGEEMIFRCVKILVFCNRGWQKEVNNFNKSAHKHLQNLSKASPAKKNGSTGGNGTECTICLNSIAPCQSLFVAPCSHTWHYKCIRPLLEDPTHPNFRYPHFLCPNCRAIADLEAEVEEPIAWDQDLSEASGDDEEVLPQTSATAGGVTSYPVEDISMRNMTMLQPPTPPPPPPPSQQTILNGVSAEQDQQGTTSVMQATEVETDFAPDALAATLAAGGLDGSIRRTGFLSTDHGYPFSHDSSTRAGNGSVRERPEGMHLDLGNSSTLRSIPLRSNALTPEPIYGPEGPMTPRNTAGPFVFDGSAGNSPDLSPDAVGRKSEHENSTKP